jgi:hypothetical protein
MHSELTGYYSADVPSSNPRYRGRGGERLLFLWDQNNNKLTFYGVVDYHNNNNGNGIINSRIWHNNIPENERDTFLRIPAKDKNRTPIVWAVRMVDERRTNLAG